VGNWELLEEDILEVRMRVRADRVPPGQQGKPINELIEVFSLHDPPLLNLGWPSLFAFDPDETAAEFVIRMRNFHRIGAPHARFSLVDDKSVERLIEREVNIADLIKSAGMYKENGLKSVIGNDRCANSVLE
jgi:hypothetical protein